jgi:hypothetical protein
MNLRLLLFAVFLGLAVISTRACSDSEADAKGSPLTDADLSDFQDDLLEVAFDAASALPVDPLIKNRSRAQEAVIAACLELDQPRRAEKELDAIANWRRGSGYADLALYCAQHGHDAQAQAYLETARQVSEKAEDESAEDGGGQGWRRDRIRAKIAGTYLWLGQPERAAAFETVVASEAGAVKTAKARLLDASEFDAELEVLQAVTAKGEFDETRNALESCAQLLDRFYDDREQRSRAADTIRSSWGKLPVQIRIELMGELTRSALDHGDPGQALELVNETQVLLDDNRWTPEFRVPLAAKLAELRYRAGDRERARSDADAALAAFEAQRDQIVNIYRAGAMRPIAETYQSMGDTPAALAVYARALEACVENPNSRPRAEDLSATCCSMALHRVEPDAALWSRIRAIRSGLGPPW